MSDWWSNITQGVADRAGRAGDADLLGEAGLSMVPPGPGPSKTPAVPMRDIIGGFAEGYTPTPGQAPVYVPGGPGYKPPQALYREGDTETIFAPKSPEDMWTIQEQLKAAGLLPKTGSSFVPGYYDRTTANALEELLAISNARGQNWQPTLQEMVTTQAANPDATQKRAPLRLSLSNPDDLRWAADQVARSLLGRRLNQPEAEAVVSEVIANETKAQQANYAATDPENPQGGVAANPPSLEATMLNDYMGGPEQTQYSMTNTFLDFADLLKSPV